MIFFLFLVNCGKRVCRTFQEDRKYAVRQGGSQRLNFQKLTDCGQVFSPIVTADSSVENSSNHAHYGLDIESEISYFALFKLKTYGRRVSFPQYLTNY